VVRMARCGLAEDLAVEIGESGKQRDGAVARVVVVLVRMWPTPSGSPGRAGTGSSRRSTAPGALFGGQTSLGPQLRYGQSRRR
jgi:hypothetical protein